MAVPFVRLLRLLVFTLLVVFTGLVAGLDFGLGEAVIKLFER